MEQMEFVTPKVHPIPLPRMIWQNGRNLTQRLCDFLLPYQRTSHATKGVALCLLFLKRSLRTRLNMLMPDHNAYVARKHVEQKIAHNCRAQDHEWFLEQQMMVET